MNQESDDISAVSAAAVVSPRLAFHRQLAAMWIRQAPALVPRIDFFRELARRAASLPSQPILDATEKLNSFRRLFIERPDEFRRRMRDANNRTRSALSPRERVALGALDALPDLLGPQEDLHHEPTHSRLIAFFMNPSQSPEVGLSLLRAFLKLVGCTEALLDPADLRSASVTPESLVEKGRVDIRIATPGLLAYVEVKVHASEGPDQLSRYRSDLENKHGTRTPLLVYLTLSDAEAPSSELACEHVTLGDLLRVWLPFAADGIGPPGYLARYLKSVALLLGAGGHGAWDRWTFSEQRKALRLFDKMRPSGVEE